MGNKFGFLEDALIEEVNYPNQIFILKRFVNNL